ncbi:MAG: flavodoxin family protein [Clostridia bacterium]|nr:flavodoxin family protein [Clostridia bacterium]
MKTVIINGSPRKGNTLAAIKALNIDAEIIYADKVDVSPCKGCGACTMTNGCIAKDDSNEVIDKIVEADRIIFATPVYWWGVTAQLKTIIDKCYCKGAHLKGKEIGVIVVGGDGVESEQYDLIKRQFELISQYLDWKMLFYSKHSASAIGDLEKNEDSIRELGGLL